MRRASLALGVLLALLMAPTAQGHGRVVHPLPGAGHAAFATHGPDAAPRPLRLGAKLARGSAASAPGAWCGDERRTDDTRHEVDRNGHRFHAVYALPADVPSRLQQVASRLQGDAHAASGLLAARFGRAVRFDRGTRCGPGNLDITTVRLPLTSAQLEHLAETPDGVLDAVARSLDLAGLATSRLGDVPRGVAGRTNYVVWLDGPAPPSSCGQATFTLDRRRTPANENNVGGKVAAIFRDGDGFCGPATVLHEISHTLGAVQPRSSDGDWTGHCVDSAADLMCDVAATTADQDARGLEIDAGNDDYWDPPGGRTLPWWTMNLSRFICADVACRPARARKTR